MIHHIQDIFPTKENSGIHNEYKSNETENLLLLITLELYHLMLSSPVEVLWCTHTITSRKMKQRML